MLPPGFEPGSKPREGFMIVPAKETLASVWTGLHYRSTIAVKNILFIKIRVCHKHDNHHQCSQSHHRNSYVTVAEHESV